MHNIKLDVALKGKGVALLCVGQHLKLAADHNLQRAILFALHTLQRVQEVAYAEGTHKPNVML